MQSYNDPQAYAYFRAKLHPHDAADNLSSFLDIKDGNYIPDKKDFETLKNDILQEMRRLNENNIKFVFYGEEGYPKNLIGANDSPVLFCVKGENPEKLFNSGKKLEVFVGSRDCTTYGRETTRIAIDKLAKGGVSTIVTGISPGIELVALQRSLDKGLPVACLMPCSLEDDYQGVNAALKKRIANTPGCAIFSQFVPKMKLEMVNALSNAKVLAAIGDNIYVTQSRAKGMAVITARLASQRGKNIFASPGRTTDYINEGCNLLIEEGTAKILW